MLRSSYYKLLLPLVVVLTLASCNLNQNDTPTGPSNNTIIIRDNSFNPATLTIAVGRVVLWKNEGASQHTVTSGTPTSNPGAIFDSGILGPNGGFTFTFGQAGQYPYYCKVHGVAMVGTVIVQ